jgi:hypothetical protein
VKALLSRFCVTAATVALVAAPAYAQMRNITFDAGGTGGALAVGSILSNQYAAFGVSFSANAFAGPGTSSSGRPWATNTDMTIVSSTGTDVGGLGTPSLVSGNLLRSFNGWLGENGDPSFRATFSVPFVTFVAMDFAGIATAADVRLFVYNGTTLLSTIVAGGTGQQTLQYTAAAGQAITSVVVAPGSFDDWVGVDNIRFTSTSNVVPEPSTVVLFATGVLALGGVARRRRVNT